MSCSIFVMKQDMEDMAHNSEQTIIVNMFYFSSLLFGD
jgi:hypothetical protein